VQQDLQLNDGSRIAVIGGGPAGSFFSFFLLDTAERVDLAIQVDIYEPRDFSRPGPIGCNMCGGIISESLVQMLASEGLILPPMVVQRGIDSYTLHMDVGSVRINTPVDEKRIAAVTRGPGPRDLKEIRWESFDGYLQQLAVEKGACVINERVREIAWEEGAPGAAARPRVRSGKEFSDAYDLLVLATGVNAAAQNLLKNFDTAYESPQTTKTFIQEYFLGEKVIAETLGSSMHVFLLDIPRLEFAAVIPKGDYVTVCLLGEDVDQKLVNKFLNTREVKGCFPPGWHPEGKSCCCSPRISVAGAKHPYGDRFVFIGDCGVTRLYKDGIGAAYRTAKAAATTAVLQGISAESFAEHYHPACRRIENDNLIGKFVFFVTGQIQRRRFTRRAVLRMTETEQTADPAKRQMSMVLWDTFTGSAPYREILLRTFDPRFIVQLLGNVVISLITLEELTPYSNKERNGQTSAVKER
jgi:flavin-dependent dehydrogenase